MLNLGVIGTNWISDSFVCAAIESDKYNLHAVYSRTMEQAENFSKKYNVKILEDDINKFVNINDLDVVYIASPNSRHFKHCIMAIEAGKHVIVEKPACSTEYEMEEVIRLSSEKNVCFFEAIRNIHEVNFEILKQKIVNMKEIRGANFSFLKYSSRYDNVLKGEVPNVFSPIFSGGALYDLGVYLIYAAVELFGIPKETFYFANMIDTKVDGMGTIVFRYNSFDVTMRVGKISDSFLKNEIYGEDETIIIDGISDIKSIEVYSRKNKETKVISSDKYAEYNLIYETLIFADIMNGRDKVEIREEYQRLLSQAKIVNSIMCDLRRKAGIIFKADD